jgi:hypothetical protein
MMTSSNTTAARCGNTVYSSHEQDPGLPQEIVCPGTTLREAEDWIKLKATESYQYDINGDRIG